MEDFLDLKIISPDIVQGRSTEVRVIRTLILRLKGSKPKRRCQRLADYGVAVAELCVRRITTSADKWICDIAASVFREKMRFKIAGDTLAAIPERIAAEVSALESIHPLRWGCTVGKLVGGGIVPDTGLAQCIMFERKAFPEAELSLQQALSYLRKESLSLPEVPKGFVTVTYGGHPLGFVKNIGNRCNNLYSSGRRIRMNIH